MSSTNLSEFRGVIEKALEANLALLFYFILPNSSSLLILILLVTLLTCPKCLGEALPDKDNHWLASFNGFINWYVSASWVRKIMVMVGAALLAQLTYYLPLGLWVVLAVETWAFWELLVGFGVVEIVQGAIMSTEESLEKVVSLIPRHHD